MYRAVITGSMIALVLSGCVTSDAPRMSPQQEYQLRLQGLRNTSVRQVNAYASSVREFLKTHEEADAIERAKRAVSDDLKDPGSAQFRNVRLVPYSDTKVICGEVNAKNSYGGYAGFAHFVAGVSDAYIASRADDYQHIGIVDASNQGMNTACH